ncbi:HSP20-like chaperone [Guyanagaster necrorhizus]|uniref:HSP20-like chaperone n=1 Tax=Guyanagaster necrorhizus TaxID=856835 RepID=A0A9P7VQH2_9AGAR|nr:HSP20-like chaperone [Guyanagaster necrorhizus MCA 3950]KAG7444732.1 HSP20-like chaperone [Guyanagaster necrorhizus MCA 3950]
MSVFYYEPFYNWDRFLDQALGSSAASGYHTMQQRLAEGSHGEIQRFLKPRHVGCLVTGHSLYAHYLVRMDLHEDPSTNTVTATFEFPGLSKDEISIDVHDGRLTVSAESKISEEHEKDGYAVRERRYGKFARTLQLPRGVNDEEIKASTLDGVLTVTFPKVGTEAPGPKKISIA